MGQRLFLIPIAIVFVFLYAIPLARSLYTSFTDDDGYGIDVTFVGFKNYATVFADPEMLRALTFTVCFALATTIAVTILAIPLALVLNRAFIGRNLVRSVFFFPAVPSAAILGLVWGFVLNPLGSGVLNSAIHSLTGLGPILWLSDPTLAQISVVVVTVWSQTGWHAILYLAYLQSIPSEYTEAGMIDGANAFQRFRYLTLPQLVPAVSVSTLLLMTSGLKVYDLPFTLTKGGPGFATRTITQAIIEDGIANSQLGLASALSVLFLIAVAAVILAQLAVSRLIERRYN